MNEEIGQINGVEAEQALHVTQFWGGVRHGKCVQLHTSATESCGPGFVQLDKDKVEELRDLLTTWLVNVDEEACNIVEGYGSSDSSIRVQVDNYKGQPMFAHWFLVDADDREEVVALLSEGLGKPDIRRPW